MVSIDNFVTELCSVQSYLLDWQTVPRRLFFFCVFERVCWIFHVRGDQEQSSHGAVPSIAPPQSRRVINVFARRDVSLKAEGKYFQHPSLNTVGVKPDYYWKILNENAWVSTHVKMSCDKGCAACHYAKRPEWKGKGVVTYCQIRKKRVKTWHYH
jgi:hypothetical protein